MSTASQHFLDIESSLSTEGAPTIICRGHLTLENANRFKSEVKRFSPEHKVVFADMSGVDYVDSSGLGILVATFVSTKSDGSELRLIKVHPRVKDLLDMTQLSRLFGDTR